MNLTPRIQGATGKAPGITRHSLEPITGCSGRREGGRPVYSAPVFPAAGRFSPVLSPSWQVSLRRNGGAVSAVRSLRASRGKPWDRRTRRNERHRSSIQDSTDAHPRGRGDDYEDRHGISGRARDFSRSYPKSRADVPGFGSERPSRYRMDSLVTRILKTPDLAENGFPTLRGHPPLGTCTVCSGNDQ